MPNRPAWNSWNECVFNHFMGTSSRGMEVCDCPPTAEARAWRERERAARERRRPPIWDNENWWRDHYLVWKWHFAHMSTKSPGLLAYTENEDKGLRDIQTVLKPGRYLEKFFRDILTEKEIKYYATWCATGSRPPSKWSAYPLKFAMDGDTIAWVYAHGVYSCMRDYGLERHPARAYATGDLGVAYLEGEPPENCTRPSRRVVARAIVWPEKKMASRVYPTPTHWIEDGFTTYRESEACQNALHAKLKAENYLFPTELGWSMSGARILRDPVLLYYDNFELEYRDSDHWETV